MVQQEDNPATGFSATLFQNIETGGYHLATRGSAGFSFSEPDWIYANRANGFYGISYNQVTDLLNFYLRLTSLSDEVAQFAFEEGYFFQDDVPPSQSYILIDTLEMEPGATRTRYLTFSEIDSAPAFGSISNTQQFNVTGHSLSGHLASAFTLLFPSIVGSTSTFNSAGFVGDRFDEFANFIAHRVNDNGIVDLQPDLLANSSVNVTNIRAPLDIVSDLPIVDNIHLGGQQIE